MRQISNEKLKAHFIAWQCRIRQLSARDYGGRPLAAMMPRVSDRKGAVVLSSMMTLIVPEDPAAAAAFLRFQIQKTHEPERARDAALKYLAADFYQLPELFSDEMTAVFGKASGLAKSIIGKREVLLDFEQFSQSFRMFCKVRKLGLREEGARFFSLCQARVFNPDIPADAEVLGFRPLWKNAAADPLPP